MEVIGDLDKGCFAGVMEKPREFKSKREEVKNCSTFPRMCAVKKG